MRAASISVGAVAVSIAGALTALAQSTPLPATAANQTRERKLMPIAWDEVREALRTKQLARAQFRQVSIPANAAQPSLPTLLPVDKRIAAAAVSVFPQAHSYSASMRMGDIT